MFITRIVVSGLFDYFNYEIKFKPQEHITIMIGPNGFGKTMILRLINTLFNKSIQTLEQMPFQSLIIDFNDNSILNVSRNTDKYLQIVYEIPSGKKYTYNRTYGIDTNQFNHVLDDIDEAIPELERVSSREWYQHTSGSTLNLEDIISIYGHILSWAKDIDQSDTNKWFRDIRNKISVRFIDTERLTQHISYRPMRIWIDRDRDQPRNQRKVQRCSEELSKRVQKTLSEYGSHAQSLDRTFPARLVEELPHSPVSKERLSKELAEIEDKRSRLVDAGLLVQEHEGPEVPPLEEIDESSLGVLAVYAQDAKDKLRIFDDLYSRIDLLKRICNSRFLYKEVTVGTGGLDVVNSNGSKLKLEELSSGEQHELVILYELLFRVEGNSLILVDEPELSLHVAWQDTFLDDLEEIAAISKFQVLLATHSPQIIGDRWDLAVKLKGPEEQ